MTATAVNAATAEDRWPGALDGIRSHPFISAGLFAAVSVLVAVVLVATDRRWVGRGSAAAAAALIGDPLDGLMGQEPDPLETTERGHVSEGAPTPSGRPAELPQPWNVPPQSFGYIQRHSLQVKLRDRLRRAGAVVVQGVGGLGKTALVIEYASRFAECFQLVWWIDAEQVELIQSQFARLAVAAGWVGPHADQSAAAEVAYQRLRQEPGWLLILDNAEDPALIRPLLPQGPGQTLITSRSLAWAGEAETIAPGLLARVESVALLLQRAPRVTPADAEALAEAMGDLPLALVQAAGVLQQTGMPTAQYLTELARHPATVLDAAAPASHARSLAGTVAVATERLRAADPLAAQLLNVCAFMAPEPVPVEVFTDATTVAGLPDAIAAIAGSPFTLRQAIGTIARYGLAEVSANGLVVHRLTQAVLRDLLDHNSQDRARLAAETLVAAAAPARIHQASDHNFWSGWENLLPHLLALSPATSTSPALRHAAIQMIHYLVNRGERRIALSLATDLHDDSHRRYGPDAPETLNSASALAFAHRTSGQRDEALRLDQHVLSRRRQILGDEHLDTLHAEQHVAIGLAHAGQHEQSLQLNQHVLDCRRGLLGDDDPYTLAAANNLGENLRAVGMVGRARATHEDALARRRRAEGDDSLGTLIAAISLAEDLQALGLHAQSKALNEDTVARARRSLGDHHEVTMDAQLLLQQDQDALTRQADQ